MLGLVRTSSLHPTDDVGLGDASELVLGGTLGDCFVIGADKEGILLNKFLVVHFKNTCSCFGNFKLFRGSKSFVSGATVD